MIVSGDTSVMLLVEPFFEGFIAPQEVADTSRSREVIVGLSADSRRQVDERTDKALAAGANELGEPQDEGFMYMRGFRDLDGHQWSFIRMDLSAIPRVERRSVNVQFTATLQASHDVTASARANVDPARPHPS